MVRSVYYMNLDGTNRVKVAHNARQACWGPDGQTIAFLKSEFDRYNYADYATKGVYFYDLKTGKTTEHSNCANLYHLYNLCCRRTASGSSRPCTAAWASSTRTSPSRPRARRSST